MPASIPDDTAAAPLVARGRVRSVGWTRVATGIHRRVDAPDAFVAEALAWRLVLPPSARFSGLTAARLRGWDLPRLPVGLPVQVAMPQGTTAPRRAGLAVSRHRSALDGDTVHGLPVTSPAETLLTCASVVCLVDLVVLVDSALRAGDVDPLECWLVASQRRRGAPSLRRALTLADCRSESAMETPLRLLLVLCGHDVVAQHEVRDAAGTFVARGDLWLRGTTTLLEYDGAVHRGREQHRDDLRRDRRLTAAGWTRHGYTVEDLVRRPVTILRDADRAVGRIHDPTLVRAWTAALRESTLTDSGEARLRERLQRTPRRR